MDQTFGIRLDVSGEEKVANAMNSVVAGLERLSTSSSKVKQVVGSLKELGNVDFGRLKEGIGGLHSSFSQLDSTSESLSKYTRRLNSATKALSTYTDTASRHHKQMGDRGMDPTFPGGGGGGSRLDARGRTQEGITSAGFWARYQGLTMVRDAAKAVGEHVTMAPESAKNLKNVNEMIPQGWTVGNNGHPGRMDWLQQRADEFLSKNASVGSKEDFFSVVKMLNSAIPLDSPYFGGDESKGMEQTFEMAKRVMKLSAQGGERPENTAKAMAGQLLSKLHNLKPSELSKYQSGELPISAPFNEMIASQKYLQDKTSAWSPDVKSLMRDFGPAMQRAGFNTDYIMGALGTLKGENFEAGAIGKAFRNFLAPGAKGSNALGVLAWLHESKATVQDQLAYNKLPKAQRQLIEDEKGKIFAREWKRDPAGMHKRLAEAYADPNLIHGIIPNLNQVREPVMAALFSKGAVKATENYMKSKPSTDKLLSDLDSQTSAASGSSYARGQGVSNLIGSLWGKVERSETGNMAGNALKDGLIAANKVMDMAQSKNTSWLDIGATLSRFSNPMGLFAEVIRGVSGRKDGVLAPGSDRNTTGFNQDMGVLSNQGQDKGIFSWAAGGLWNAAKGLITGDNAGFGQTGEVLNPMDYKRQIMEQGSTEVLPFQSRNLLQSTLPDSNPFNLEATGPSPTMQQAPQEIKVEAGATTVNVYLDGEQLGAKIDVKVQDAISKAISRNFGTFGGQ